VISRVYQPFQALGNLKQGLNFSKAPAGLQDLSAILKLWKS
jgi:hypothetical protein